MNKGFDQTYDIKQENIVEWFGKRWNLYDEIDVNHLYYTMQHASYREGLYNVLAGDMVYEDVKEFNRQRKALTIAATQGKPEYPTGFNYHINPDAEYLIISIGVEPPRREDCSYLNIKEGFKQPVHSYPNCFVEDFDVTVNTIQEIIREKFPDKFLNCNPEKVIVYASGIYAGAGIALAGWTGYTNCYIEHGENTYSWRSNPHCARHRKAKVKGWIYNPELQHKMAIVRCHRLRQVVSQITDPIRHLDDWPELRITYAMTPEQPGLELYQDYIWDYKNEQIQVVKPDFKQYMKNLTNP